MEIQIFWVSILVNWVPWGAWVEYMVQNLGAFSCNLYLPNEEVLIAILGYWMVCMVLGSNFQGDLDSDIRIAWYGIYGAKKGNSAK